MIIQVKLKDRVLLFKPDYAKWGVDEAGISLEVSSTDGEIWNSFDESIIDINSDYYNMETFVMNYLRDYYKDEALEITTRIHTELGDFYISPDMTDGGIAFVVLDSDKEFVANCYNENLVDELYAVKDIYELVDVMGLGNNLIYGESKLDCRQEFESYATGCGNDDSEILAIIQERDLPINRVGYNYFILDYTEI